MYDIVNLFDLNKFKQKISFLLSIFNLMQMTVQGRRMSLISGNGQVERGSSCQKNTVVEKFAKRNRRQAARALTEAKKIYSLTMVCSRVTVLFCSEQQT